ncbi:Replication factor A protein 1 [Entophlyctis luteolus]|nr:Replication factor A protein 1 [Entophlyctis luteolus]
MQAPRPHPLADKLSVGAIYNISTGAANVDRAVLQVISVKKMVSQNQDAAQSLPSDRYRIILSDGVHAMQGMLATQLNPLIVNESVTKHAVIEITKLLCNVVGGRRILIVLDLMCLHPGVVADPECPRIGNPSPDINAPPPGMNNAPQNAPQNIAADHLSPQQNQLSANRPLPNHQPNASTNQQQYQQNQNYQAQQTSRQAPSGGQPRQAVQSTVAMYQHQANPTDVAIFPIKSLSPYQNKWTIRARVISKSDIRTYNNAKGPGQLFSCVFGDDSGEIRATGFNDVVSQFYDLLVEGKVYYISKCAVKLANRQFSGGVDNDYEMTLDLGSLVTECVGPGVSGSMGVVFRRVMIGDVGGIEKDAVIDIVGVVTEPSTVQELTSKAGKALKKRDLTICDESARSIRLTLWARLAENFPDSPGTVAVFKGCKVGDYGGRSLSAVGGASVLIDADVPDCHAVRGWWIQRGQSAGDVAGYSGGGAESGNANGAKGVAGIKAIARIVEENMGHGEKPDWLTLRATISFIKQDNMFYPACQTADCAKKVVDDGGGWRCERCNKSFPAPRYRYIFNAKVLDHSGEAWISFFNEQGEAMFGVSANELHELQETDPDRFRMVVESVVWKQFDIRARVKMDTYGDEGRIRTSAQTVMPIHFANAAVDLANAIEAA